MMHQGTPQAQHQPEELVLGLGSGGGLGVGLRCRGRLFMAAGAEWLRGISL